MRALLLGDAKCVNADAAAALALCRFDAVAATNNMGIDWPGRLDYWFTLHIPAAEHWPGIFEAMRKRLAAGKNRPQVWAHRPGKGIDRDTPDWAGSTGLLGVKGLIEEGFTRIVAAGVPLSYEQGHYYDVKPWASAKKFQPGWIKHKQEIAPYFRSMSGWTRAEFGAPTAEWLGVDAGRAGDMEGERLA